jgi:hypothetical protein
MVVGAVRFWLSGSGSYRNSDRIVHLYNYLLDGARSARSRATTAQLVSDDASFDDGLIGPLRITESAALAVSAGSIGDADGIELTGTVPPNADFYLRPRPGADDVLLTATVPAPLTIDFAIYCSMSSATVG